MLSNDLSKLNDELKKVNIKFRKFITELTNGKEQIRQGIRYSEPWEVKTDYLFGMSIPENESTQKMLIENSEMIIENSLKEKPMNDEEQRKWTASMPRLKRF